MKEIPENGSDSTHFDVVHRDSMLTGKCQLGFLNKILEHYWDAEWVNVCSAKHIGHLRLKNFYKSFNFETGFGDLKVYQIGPSLVNLYFELKVLGLNQRGVFIQSVISVGPNRQRIINRLYMEKGLLNLILAPFALYGVFMMVS